MNEQDIMLKEKIEKREKFDTILAYILMVILLGCIVGILILKFTKKEENVVNPNEYVPNYISLTDIVNSLNRSELVNNYISEGASFNSSISGNSLVINYTKDEVDFDLNIPVVGNELMITMIDEYKDNITDIYKEIATTICVHYGNQENLCRNTLETMNEKGNDGIRFDNTANNNVIYIDTTKSYTVNTEIVYTEVVKVDLNETNYVLNMLDIKLYNINIINNETGIKFSGNIDRLSDDNSNISIAVKLFDNDNNVIAENKYDYNEENVLNETGLFEIEFLFGDTLKLENIVKYTIEIIK